VNDSKGSGLSLASAVDSEVPAKPQRRSFTAEYKKRILEECDAATEKGAIGAIMRRERIYSSTLSGWRKEREAAVHQAFSQKRGPHPKRNPLSKENDKLRRQNQRLQEDLEKARIVIEVQKKVARLLGQLTPSTEEDQ
jgi:transposase